MKFEKLKSFVKISIAKALRNVYQLHNNHEFNTITFYKDKCIVEDNNNTYEIYYKELISVDFSEYIK